jgi:hypothetical protein
VPSPDLRYSSYISVFRPAPVAFSCHFSLVSLAVFLF